MREFELKIYGPFHYLLISHWSRVLSEIFLHYHNIQPFSFPKWYDNWKLGQNWRCYEQKHCSKIAKTLKCKKFQVAIRGTKPQNFVEKGIFGWPWIDTICFWGQNLNLRNWSDSSCFFCPMLGTPLRQNQYLGLE